MLDEDTALVLLKIAAENGATIALVGDRAQLSAIGRGGVLEMAADVRGRVVDMAEVHRFAKPEYADLTIQMRHRTDPATVFDHLHQLGLIQLHPDIEQLNGTALTVDSPMPPNRQREPSRDLLTIDLQDACVRKSKPSPPRPNGPEETQSGGVEPPRSSVKELMERQGRSSPQPPELFDSRSRPERSELEESG